MFLTRISKASSFPFKASDTIYNEIVSTNTAGGFDTIRVSIDSVRCDIDTVELVTMLYEMVSILY